jgi:hypothetical protein
MDLHLTYEQAEPYPLAREDLDPETLRRAIVARLIARGESGTIEVDTLNAPCRPWSRWRCSIRAVLRLTCGPCAALPSAAAGRSPAWPGRCTLRSAIGNQPWLLRPPPSWPPSRLPSARQAALPACCGRRPLRVPHPERPSQTGHRDGRPAGRPSWPRLFNHIVLPYREIGLLHEEGKFTGVLVLTPVNSTCTSKSPSNLRGSYAPL